MNSSEIIALVPLWQDMKVAYTATWSLPFARRGPGKGQHCLVIGVKTLNKAFLPACATCKSLVYIVVTSKRTKRHTAPLYLCCQFSVVDILCLSSCDTSTGQSVMTETQ